MKTPSTALALSICGLLLSGCVAPIGTKPSPGEPPAGRPAVATPDLAARARDEIGRAFASPDPVVRSQALEATQNDLGTGAPPAVAADERARIVAALSSDVAQERFAAAMAAGAVRLRDAHPKLLAAVNDPSPRVRVAAIYALHRLGDTRRSHDLERYAQDEDWAVRGDTAVALGLLRDPSAVKPLAFLLRDPNPTVRLQAAEALWRHGDERGLNALVAATINEAADDQMIALLGLARTGDPRLASNIALQMASPYDEVRLVAARALAMVGNNFGFQEAESHVGAKDARQRALAALALGAMKVPASRPLLSKLLSDPDASVRIAAANAVVQMGPG